MSSIYSHRFLVGHAGATEYYYCPDGYVAVVRCVTAFNAEAVSQESFNLVHQPSGATIYYALLQQFIGEGPPAYAAQELRFLFYEGEYLHAFGDGNIDYSVSGYLLELP